MRVLGYRFARVVDASLARRELRRRFALNPGDARLGPLPDDGVVLAVRAREDNLGEVKRLLDLHGGEVLVDIDERRTGLSRNAEPDAGTRSALTL